MSTGFDHEERAQIGRIYAAVHGVAAAARQCQKLYVPYSQEYIVFDNRYGKTIMAYRSYCNSYCQVLVSVKMSL